MKSLTSLAPLTGLALCTTGIAASAQGWCISEFLTSPTPTEYEHAGSGAALDGDVAVVGAPTATGTGTPGQVYVYERTGAAWNLTATLTSTSQPVGEDDLFGVEVEVEGDRILVGANLTNGGLGRVYVFEKQGGSWVETAVIDSPGVGGVGTAVELDGDRFFAFPNLMYELQGGSWVHVDTLVTSDGGGSVGGNNPIDLDGERAVIVDNFIPGGVYVFELQAGDWVEVTKIPTPLNPGPGAFLTVALDGDRIVASRGAVQAYVFDLQGGSWVLTQELVPNVTAGEYGRSLAVQGDRILVGDRTGQGGQAFFYELQGGTWVETDHIQQGTVDAPFQLFHPWHMNFDGDQAIVGWARSRPDGVYDAGAATIFDFTTGTPAAAVVRNGSGANPLDFSSQTLPVMGSTWDSTIDLTPDLGTTTTATFVAYEFVGPFSGLFTGPYEILLNPTADIFFDAGLGSHSLPVPCQSVLEGVTVYTQGVRIELLGTSPRLVLTNAIDLTVGS